MMMIRYFCEIIVLRRDQNWVSESNTKDVIFYNEEMDEKWHVTELPRCDT